VNVTVNEITATRKEVVIAVNSEEIAAQDKAVMKEFAKHAKIPGFRPGKAPEAIIRTKFAKEMAEELNRQVLASAYEYMSEASGLAILNVVAVDEHSRIITRGEPANILFTVDIEPVFELPEYKGIEVSVDTKAVEADEIETMLNRIYMQRANFEVVERAAEKGDYVKLSYSGTVAGTPTAELCGKHAIYGEQKNTWEEAGSETAPGVRAIIDGIVGMKAGDTKTVTHTFADTFFADDLAGKTAEYTLEIEEVRERVLPKIDEEFLKPFGVKTEDELRERIADDLKSQREHEQLADVREKVLEALLERVEVDVPQSLTDSYVEPVLRRMFEAEHYRKSLPEGEADLLDLDRNAMVEASKKEAEKLAKTTLILMKISEKEKLKITNEDLNREIMRMAYSMRMQPQDVVAMLKKDKGYLANMQREALTNKTLDFLAKEAKVNA
jgi:trigger factor